MLGPKLMISNLIACSIAILVDVGISREGYLELLIACIGVLVTLVAVILALLGFYGYASLRQAVTEVAAREAKDAASAVALNNLNDELEQKIRSTVEVAVQSALRNAFATMQGADLSNQQSQERSNTKTRSGRMTSRRAQTDSDLEK